MDSCFNSGGSGASSTRDGILEYDPETKEWTQIGTMMETSWGHGVSVVDFTDYANFCK